MYAEPATRQRRLERSLPTKCTAGQRQRTRFSHRAQGDALDHMAPKPKQSDAAKIHAILAVRMRELMAWAMTTDVDQEPRKETAQLRTMMRQSQCDSRVYHCCTAMAAGRPLASQRLARAAGWRGRGRRRATKVGEGLTSVVRGGWCDPSLS
jgi:hypothetical protein